MVAFTGAATQICPTCTGIDSTPRTASRNRSTPCFYHVSTREEFDASPAVSASLRERRVSRCGLRVHAHRARLAGRRRAIDVHFDERRPPAVRLDRLEERTRRGSIRSISHRERGPRDHPQGADVRGPREPVLRWVAGGAVL